MSNTNENSSRSGDDIPWAWLKAVNDTLFNEPWDPIDGCLPVQLRPWLWLSDQRHAAQANKMMELGITHVLSMNAMHDDELRQMRERLNRVGIQHMFVEGYDETAYDMLGNHLEECLKVLKDVRKSGKRIVVHCAAETNRSGLIACAAVMLLERLPLLDVVKDVKRKRGMLLTNLAFQRQLCVLAMQEDLLGTKPEGYTDDPIAFNVNGYM